MTQRKKNIHTHLLETQLLNALRKKMEKRKMRKKKTPDKNQQTLTMHFYNKKKQTKKDAKNCKIKTLLLLCFIFCQISVKL